MTTRTIAAAGTFVRARARAGKREVLTAEDAKDPRKLAELVTRLAATLEELQSAAAKPCVDFQDVALPASGSVRLEHRFGGRVRWWVVEVSASLAITNWPRTDTTNTTSNVLVLTSTQAMTATIRVEAT